MRCIPKLATLAIGLGLLACGGAAAAADLSGLRRAVERGEARAIIDWLQSPAAAVTEDILAPLAGTGAVPETMRGQASRLAATEDFVGLLALEYAEHPAPAMRGELLALIDRHANDRAALLAEVRRAAAARPVPAPLRIVGLEILGPPAPHLVARYTGGRAGDVLHVRWLLVDPSTGATRPGGERDVSLAAGDGKVDIPLSSLNEPGAYRVEVTGRDVAAVTVMAIAPAGPPGPPQTSQTPTPAEERRDEVRYATRALVLRAGPDATAKEVGRLKAGEAARVVGALPAQDWLIVDRNKVRAYAPAALLSTEAPKPPAAAPPVTGAPPVRAIEGEARVVDTAHLVVGGRAIVLAGIEGLGGVAAEQMARFVAEQGGRLRCVPQNAAFVCRTPSDIDVARAALVNGAARARPDASADYRRQEEAARAGRRGIWANS